MNLKSNHGIDDIGLTCKAFKFKVASSSLIPPDRKWIPAIEWKPSVSYEACWTRWRTRVRLSYHVMGSVCPSSSLIMTHFLISPLSLSCFCIDGRTWDGSRDGTQHGAHGVFRHLFRGRGRHIQTCRRTNDKIIKIAAVLKSMVRSAVDMDFSRKLFCCNELVRYKLSAYQEESCWASGGCPQG